MNPPLQGRIITDRQREIVRIAREQSIRRAADHFGLSYGRVRQLVRIIAQRELDLAVTGVEERLPIAQRRIEFTSMPTRARNALTRAGYVTCGEVLALAAADVLDVENASKATLSDVEAYLGVTLPGPRRSRLKQARPTADSGE